MIFKRIAIFWRKHLNSFRYGLAFLFVATTLLGVFVLTWQLGVGLALILQVASAIELSWAAASHIYLNNEPKAWRRYLSVLTKLSSLMNPRNESMDLDELVREKTSLSGDAFVLPDIGSFTDKVTQLVINLGNWIPVSLDDQSRGAFHDTILRFIEEMRHDHGLLLQFPVREAYSRWIRAFLSETRRLPSEVIDEIRTSIGMPPQVVAMLSESTVYDPVVIISSAQWIRPDGETLSDLVRLFEHRETKRSLEKCSPVVARLLGMKEYASLGNPLLKAIEDPEVPTGVRLVYLQNMVDSGHSQFSTIGPAAIDQTVNLPDRQRTAILHGAIDSPDPSIQEIVFRFLENGDKDGADLVSRRVMNWNPNVAERAIVYLHDARYPDLMNLLFKVAREHREVATRRDALKYIGEWGDYTLLKHLHTCFEEEGDEDMRSHIEMAIRLLEKKTPHPRFVRSVMG